MAILTTKDHISHRLESDRVKNNRIIRLSRFLNEISLLYKIPNPDISFSMTFVLVIAWDLINQTFNNGWNQHYKIIFYCTNYLLTTTVNRNTTPVSHAAGQVEVLWCFFLANTRKIREVQAAVFSSYHLAFINLWMSLTAIYGRY